MAYRKFVKRAYPVVAKRARVYVPAVKQLASDVMYLKGLINSEPKYHIVNNYSTFDYNGVIVSLSSIQQTTQVNARDGNMVLPRFHSLNMIFGASNTATTPVSIRYIVFRYWGESTNLAGAVTVPEILWTTGSMYAPLSHLNDDITGSKGDRQRRIEILKSEILSCDLVQNRTLTRQLNFVMNNTEKKEHIKWNSAATAEPVSGGIYALFISDSATLADSFYKIESKLTFYDN